MEFHPLSPARFGDLAALFEEGGDPRWCWCTSFRVRGRDFSNSTPSGNRAMLEALAAADRAPGLLAYDGERAIGWVSFAPREDFERLTYSKILAPVDDAPVWSIVCFVVSRRERGKGVAIALLDAAIAYARHHGATTLEAYPADTGGGRIKANYAYGGTVAMFERAGFDVVERRRWNASTPIRPIVRLALGGPRGQELTPLPPDA